MEKLINKIFEKIIFFFKPHLFKRNIFKLYFYKIFYLIFKKIITSPILINFGEFNYDLDQFNTTKDSVGVKFSNTLILSWNSINSRACCLNSSIISSGDKF